MNRWLSASLLLLCAPAWATELVITEKNGETAVVLIDEFVKGETPLETSADAGSVELAFRGSMFGPVLFTHPLDIPASGKVELVVDMGGRSVEVVSSGAGEGGGDTASTGSVTIRAKTDGLGLTLDGKSIEDKTPATLELEPGKHIVAVESACHSGEAEFTVEAGGSQTVDITLTALKAMLSIKSDPSGADIFIDGKELGKAPMNAKLRCGERTLKAVKEGFEATEQKVEVGVDNAITLSLGGDDGGSSTATTAPKPVAPTPKPAKPNKTKGDGPKIAPIAVGSAAVVAAVPVGLLGAYNYQQARIAYDDYLEVTDEETRDQIYDEQVRPRQTVAFAEFAGAGVLAIGGGALIVAGLVDGEGVYAAPTANGFVIGGRF